MEGGEHDAASADSRGDTRHLMAIAHTSDCDSSGAGARMALDSAAAAAEDELADAQALAVEVEEQQAQRRTEQYAMRFRALRRPRATLRRAATAAFLLDAGFVDAAIPDRAAALARPSVRDAPSYVRAIEPVESLRALLYRLSAGTQFEPVYLTHAMADTSEALESPFARLARIFAAGTPEQICERLAVEVQRARLRPVQDRSPDAGPAEPRALLTADSLVPDPTLGSFAAQLAEFPAETPRRSVSGSRGKASRASEPTPFVEGDDAAQIARAAATLLLRALDAEAVAPFSFDSLVPPLSAIIFGDGATRAAVASQALHARRATLLAIEPVGLQLTSSPIRALPSELGLLASKSTSCLFWAKVANGTLLAYQCDGGMMDASGADTALLRSGRQDFVRPAYDSPPMTRPLEIALLVTASEPDGAGHLAVALEARPLDVFPGTRVRVTALARAAEPGVPVRGCVALRFTDASGHAIDEVEFSRHHAGVVLESFDAASCIATVRGSTHGWAVPDPRTGVDQIWFANALRTGEIVRVSAQRRGLGVYLDGNADARPAPLLYDHNVIHLQTEAEVNAYSAVESLGGDRARIHLNPAMLSDATRSALVASAGRAMLFNHINPLTECRELDCEWLPLCFDFDARQIGAPVRAAPKVYAVGPRGAAMLIKDVCLCVVEARSDA